MHRKKYNIKDFLLDERFQKWVKEPDEESQTYWNNFLRFHPEAKKELEEARRLLLQFDFYAEPRSETTKARIKEHIDEAIRESALSANVPASRSLQDTHSWMKVAVAIAGFILLAGVCTMFFFSNNHTEYATKYSETETITLPDNSVVTLNANSSIRFDEGNWDYTPRREVWLTGEAYFEVEKKKINEGEDAKFIVHTGDLNVEVLGTEFNVNVRHQQTKVVLSSGSIKLSIHEKLKEGEKEILMKPGDMVVLNKNKHELEKKVVDILYYTAWKENKLIFKNTPVVEIIQLIKDNYGLSVMVAPESLLDKEFTGAAPADNLDILLDKIAVIYDLKITRQENELKIEQN